MEVCMGQIEQLARAYAGARNELSELVGELNAEIEAAKRRRMARLKNLVGRSAAAQSSLLSAVKASPQLFRKPRTVVLHGVTVGWRKSKGSLEWHDEAQVIRLIKKHLEDQADVLISTTERVNKSAMGNLPVADLKRIGVEVCESGDQVVVKPADSEVDKVVNALLRGAMEDAQES